jgi:hypothetical protein
MAPLRTREELMKLARSFPAAAGASAWVVPWIGAAVAVGDFELNQDSPSLALGSGLVAAAIAWVAVAVLITPMPRFREVAQEDSNSQTRWEIAAIRLNPTSPPRPSVQTVRT